MAGKYCIWVAYRLPHWRDTVMFWGDLRTVFTAGDDLIITDSDNNDGNYNILAVIWENLIGATKIEILLNSLTDVEPFPWTDEYPCPGVQYNPATGNVIYGSATNKVHWLPVNMFGLGSPE